MMKTKLNEIQRKPWLVFGVALVAGLLLGWLLFRGKGTTHEHTKAEKAQVWTCSMDPQVRQDHPGTCPICGMDLIPLTSGTQASTTDENAVTLSEEAVALANIQTEVVGTGVGGKEIRLFGKVEADQRLQQSQAAYAGGRIERLFINAVGDAVSKGQALATIYSPELYTAGQELVTALDYPDERQRKVVTDAAIEKLKLLNVEQAQINTLLRSDLCVRAKHRLTSRCMPTHRARLWPRMCSRAIM